MMRSVIDVLVLILLVMSCVNLNQSEGFGDEQTDDEDAAFLQDREHLMSHLHGYKIDADEATDEELEYYFFWTHDYDKNRKLDGLELMSALTHEGVLQRADARSDLTPEERTARKKQTKDRIMHSVDRLLDVDDKNKDGYISWQEYTHTRRTREALKAANAPTLTDDTEIDLRELV